MKTIGLLGGMSWQSTAHYYRLLNQGINNQLGGLHSAKIVMVSIDFHFLENLMRSGDWSSCADHLTDAARKIEAGGADMLLICTNTMHKVAEEIAATVQIPLLHIADATAANIKKSKLRCIGLLGTRFTMEEDFYRGRLSAKHGLEVVIPEAPDRKIIDDVIFDELCQGIVSDTSRLEYLHIIGKMQAQGAEGIIAGCTEIGMLVTQDHTPTPLFDTTVIHVDAAIRFALTGNP
ncbi:MAG: aspartate/glutamate racemase family protein [Proteobacteria bacterium]|nr:aspartate/glutamate racemase family protein [Pseudomonadota bacterium]